MISKKGFKKHLKENKELVINPYPKIILANPNSACIRTKTIKFKRYSEEKNNERI